MKEYKDGKLVYHLDYTGTEYYLDYNKQGDLIHYKSDLGFITEEYFLERKYDDGENQIYKQDEDGRKYINKYLEKCDKDGKKYILSEKYYIDQEKYDLY